MCLGCVKLVIIWVANGAMDIRQGANYCAVLFFFSIVEEQQPATVKRSGSWGKQLRLGNADKPKLDVQLPTDFEEGDTPIDPNRPQFGDWDEPPVRLTNVYEMHLPSNSERGHIINSSTLFP